MAAMCRSTAFSLAAAVLLLAPSGALAWHPTSYVPKPKNCSALEETEGVTRAELTDDDQMNQTIRLLSKEYIAPLSFAFLFTLVVATMLEKAHVRFLPESLIVILVGAGLGFGLQAMNSFPTEILHHLSAPTLNLVFLPVLIFESGWNLRHKDFAAQFVYILIFAVLGTFISMMVCGTLIHATGDYHGITDRRTAYTFASLISATDPVATLATYSSLKVDPLLNILVFGESTVNDAVAIVVFEILNGEDIYGPPCNSGFLAPPGQTLVAIILGIVKKLGGSFVIGVGLAIIYTLVLRIADMRHSTSMEILFIVFSCYLTFSVAELLHMSGIIAVLFCSIMMGIYTKKALSPEGAILATFFIKELAAWADMGIFLLVGINMLLTTGTSWRFSAWVMLFLLVARAVATFPCGLLANCIKGIFARRTGKPALMLSGRHLFMMWHAGLRGGIALVLCLEMGDWVDIRGGEGTKQILINTTITVIVIFLLVFGGTTEATLNALKIPTGVDADERLLYDKSLLTCTHSCFAFCDKKVLKPVLVGRKGKEDAQALPESEQDVTDMGTIDSHLNKHSSLKRGQTWFSSHHRRRDGGNKPVDSEGDEEAADDSDESSDESSAAE